MKFFGRIMRSSIFPTEWNTNIFIGFYEISLPLKPFYVRMYRKIKGWFSWIN